MAASADSESDQPASLLQPQTLLKLQRAHAGHGLEMLIQRRRRSYGILEASASMLKGSRKLRLIQPIARLTCCSLLSENAIWSDA